MVLEDTLISIHALREEGDHLAAAVANELINFNPRPPRGGRPPLAAPATARSWYFNPRPPRGGRPNTRCGAMAGRRFQSTPSARRATTGQGTAEACRLISIHALREEGDPLRPSLPAFALYFNPRPPRGGRLMASSLADRRWRFQSTPSARRATPCRRQRPRV